MIIDFNIVNSRLSHISQTDNEQIQTQLRFSFDDGWTGLIKTAVFIPSAKTAPLSICLDSENSCFAAAEAAGDYKMYIVGSDSAENIAVTTNTVDVTLTQGNVIVLSPSTTAALIDELNADAASIKADVSAAAQAAETLTKAAEDYETYKSEIDTAVAAKANQSDVDTINAVLSGAIKNKGDVKSLTIPLPITDKSMLNCAYNVIDGFIPAQDSTIYAWAAFQYKLTLNHIKIYVDTATNKYYLELSTDTDIPAELYYVTWGEKKFYNEPKNVAIMMNDTVQRFSYVDYSETHTPYEKLLRFEWIYTPNGTAISSFRDEQSWVYTADNVVAAWSVKMNVDDNFIITEHGFDIQMYPITDYVTTATLNAAVDKKVDKETGKGLSTNDFTTALKIKLNNGYSRGQIDTKIKSLQDGKADKTDVYTKTEIDEKTADKRKAIPHTTISGNSITITDALADEQPLEMRVYGCKNLIPYPYANTTKTESGVTFTDNGDGSITVNGTATAVIYYHILRQTGFALSPGKYYFSDNTTNTAAPRFLAQARKITGNGSYAQSTVTGAGILNLSSIDYDIIWCAMTIPKGTTVDNVTYRPQIEKGISATDYEIGTGIGDLNNGKYEIPVKITGNGQEHTATAILDTPLAGSEYVDFVSKKRNGDTDITVNGDITLFDGANSVVCQTVTAPSKMEMSYYQNINNIIDETNTALTALQTDVSGLADTGKYDTIVDYTYTGEEAATELNILLTQEQLQKIKKYEKFFCYVTYNVSATTGTTSFWATATLNMCAKGTTTPLAYGGIYMRAANTVQKITTDNTPITWIATTEKVRLPDSDVCITNVLDYGGTRYSLFNVAQLQGGSSRLFPTALYHYPETNYDWVMQLKSPTTMPFTNGMKFIMWGK